MNLFTLCDLAFIHPANWTNTTFRKCYIILSPITVPLHLILIGTIIIGMIIFLAITYIVICFLEVWTGNHPHSPKAPRQ